MELGNLVYGNSRGKYSVPRTKELYIEFVRLFDACEPTRDNSWREYGIEFENDVFEVMPYWWGECTCGLDGKQHNNVCKLIKPNFYHKESGLQVSWYKYPLRDSYSNIELTKELLSTIIDDCIVSLNCV